MAPCSDRSPRDRARGTHTPDPRRTAEHDLGHLGEPPEQTQPVMLQWLSLTRLATASRDGAQYVSPCQHNCCSDTATTYFTTTSNGARGTRIQVPAPVGTSTPVASSVAPTVSAATTTLRKPAIVSSWI